jgi:poly-gamma-glutamate synthesis protein (capsule biosynthesis protein)
MIIVVIAALLLSGGGPSKPAPTHHHHQVTGSTLSPGWRGDGRPVTLAFGGDVHFEGALADRLTSDPSTALGPGAPALLSDADVSMANLDSAITQSASSCPDPQGHQNLFSAGTDAFTALAHAHLTLVSQANNHAADCGIAALQQSLHAGSAARVPVVGAGADETAAFNPYRTTVHGQRIAVIAATQILDPSLQSAWTATSSQPGVASAFEVRQLVAAVEAARRTSDTVIVYLHWGAQADTCPVRQQPLLARALVQAGADIVVGSNAHVLAGAGYLGDALVDYGLGNLAFYDTSAPETSSGVLTVTVTGRHIDRYEWRPALLEDEVPVPLQGSRAHNALAAWERLRSCARLGAAAGVSLASTQTERTMPPANVISQLSRNPGRP